MEKLEVKILPYVWYNQIQAHNFWLNQNQAIIMNYMSLVLPSYAQSKVINNKTYFWWTLSKGLSDMPTLKIKETTMRNNINELIKLKLLEREVISVWWNQRAYYRITDKWLSSSTYSYPSDFNSLFQILDEKFSDGTFTESNMNRLFKYLTDKVKNNEKNIKYDLDWIDADKFAQHIMDELKRWEKWLNFKDVIDWDFIVWIVDHIKKIWEWRPWYRVWHDGKPDTWTIKRMSDNFSSMIDWWLENRKIKSLKLSINTWFKKDKL